MWMYRQLLNSKSDFEQWMNLRKETAFMETDEETWPDNYPCVIVYSIVNGEFENEKDDIKYLFVYLNDFVNSEEK